MSFNFERNSHMLPFIGTLFDALEKFDLQEDISLDFWNTEFGDTEMEFLVKFLRSRGLKKWLHLCFSECKITDSWIKLFTDVLEEKWLVEGLTLNFSGNPIWEEGMNYFIDAIGRMWLKKDMKLYFVQMDGPVSPKSDSENLDSVTNRWTRLINMIERVGLQEWFHLNITHNFFENTDRVFLDFIRNNLLKPWVRLEVRVDIYLRRPIIKAVEAQGHLASYVLGYDSYED